MRNGDFCLHTYVFVDGMYLKRNWGRNVQNISVLVYVDVNEEVIGRFSELRRKVGKEKALE